MPAFFLLAMLMYADLVDFENQQKYSEWGCGFCRYGTDRLDGTSFWRIYWRNNACLLKLFIIVVLAIGPSVLLAQEGILTDQKVINLKSAEAPAAPTADEIENQTRVAKRVSTDPTQIQFDEIGSTRQDNSFQPVPTRIPKNLTLTPNLPKSATHTPRHSTTGIPAKPISVPMKVLESGSIPGMTKSSPLVNTGGWTTEPTSTNSNSGFATPIAVTGVAPQISTRVVAPRFVNLGQIAPVRIQLRNTTVADAKAVKLIAILPEHAKFTAAQPQPTNVNGRKYEFIIDQVDRNRTQEIQIDLVPTSKKPLNIETQLWINNSQSVEVGVRQPNLQISSNGPLQSHTGKNMVHSITVENVGDGMAENIRLNAILPEQVELIEGQNQYFLRQLAPGKSAKIQFRSAAYRAGEIQMGFQVASKGTKPAKTISGIRVYQPQLMISASGPKMNFVNRDGIYSIQIENSGQVDVTGVEVALRVPEGMKVTTVSREANVDKNTGILVWNFDRLQAGSQQTVQLKAICTQSGEQICRIAASSKETSAEKFDLVTNVKSRADVGIQVNSKNGPVAVGNNVEFEVDLINKGSSDAVGVEVLVELPPSLMPNSNKGYRVTELDNSIQFFPVTLRPGQDRRS